MQRKERAQLPGGGFVVRICDREGKGGTQREKWLVCHPSTNSYLGNQARPAPRIIGLCERSIILDILKLEVRSWMIEAGDLDVLISKIQKVKNSNF